MTPKYPDINVKLAGEDGNAASIIGRVKRALRAGGVPEKELAAFGKEAKEYDYDHVIQTAMRWVEVD